MTHPSVFLLSLLALSFPSLSFANEWIAAEPTTPTSEYGLTIRSTPHRSPEEERAGFHLPPGFVVDLIASEPDIVKPLNLAFDKKGRLWVSQTHQYPFPSKDGEPATDSIVILEDQDGDGVFERKALFASDLNIPIGLLPVDDGAICFSIPNLWYLRDTDGDGLCDKREILYGPFDTTRDTHGLVNSLRDGGDGWVYACHGFNNQSVIAGKDGHQISMPSGNVFRFRKDGSRVELFSQGQVNPFGMAQDVWGNWFSADCHSKPISQLIRGGSYQSFGRPHDGLGFAPDMMSHQHGSTAIAGLAHTKDSKFPGSMADQFLSGNVMTSRINRNQIVYTGATAKGVELPDLLTSDDSWFRPVDLQFGPDGHLYIADFYNKIIGHYEVPLTHPDRDRTSGRIWRIRWTGENANASNAPLISHQKSPTKLATNWKELDSHDLSKTSDAMAWVASLQALSDSHTNREGLRWFLENGAKVSQLNDPVAKQTFLITFRRTLQNLLTKDAKMFEVAMQEVDEQEIAPEVREQLLTILPSCRDPRCTQVAIELVARTASRGTPAERTNAMRQLLPAIDRIADVVEDENMDLFLDLIETSSEGQNIAAFAERLIAIGARQQTQRGTVSPKLREKGRELIESVAKRYLDTIRSKPNLAPPIPWVAIPTQGTDQRPWKNENRKVRIATEGESEEIKTLFLTSSFPLGETYTGRWSTPPFPAPPSFQFSIAGHIKDSAQKVNFARLLSWDSASGITTEIARADVPRNDQGATIRWDLSQHAGKQVIFEAIDGDANTSYAWIAVGNFSTPGLANTPLVELTNLLQSLIALSGLEVESAVGKILSEGKLTPYGKFELLRPIVQGISPIEAELTTFAAQTGHWDLVEQGVPGGLSPSSSNSEWEVAWQETAPVLFKRLSATEQGLFVQRIAKYQASGRKITQWTGSGALPVDVLKVLPTTWWDGLSEVDQKGLAMARESLANRTDRSKLVESKFGAIKSIPVDLALGAKVFVEKCALCHRLGTVGQVVGPQLDGVGNRGVERLLEDILWPDRNVDEAFRVTLIRLEDGVTVAGVVTDRNDQSISLVDQAGKREVIQVDDIDEERHSNVSLMPSNMEESITDADLASLLGFLKEASKNSLF